MYQQRRNGTGDFPGNAWGLGIWVKGNSEGTAWRELCSSQLSKLCLTVQQTGAPTAAAE